MDIDNEEALKRARKILVQQLFKSTDGPVSRTVNRRFSTRLSAFLARFNVSPNSLTLASFGLALFSALAFTLGGYFYNLIGGLTAQLSSILDGCDGEIARLKFKFSYFGGWLDRVLDRYADGLIVLSITYAQWRQTPDVLVWLAGFLALTGTFMNSYTAAFFDDVLRRQLGWRAAFRLGRDVRLFLVFLGALSNQIFAVILILAVITNAESIRRLFAIRHAHSAPEAH